MKPQFVVDGIPQFVKVGEKTVLGVYVINSGRSPALAVRSKTNAKASRATEPFFADYPPAKTKTVESTSVLQPGMRMQLASLPAGVPLTTEHVDGFRSGEWIVYFYGEIIYEDIFGQSQHTTHFCLMMSPDLQELRTCHAYNDAN